MIERKPDCKDAMAYQMMRGKCSRAMDSRPHFRQSAAELAAWACGNIYDSGWKERVSLISKPPSVCNISSPVGRGRGT